MTTNCLNPTVEIMQKHYIYQTKTISDNVQQNTGIMIQQESHKPLTEPLHWTMIRKDKQGTRYNSAILFACHSNWYLHIFLQCI